MEYVEHPLAAIYGLVSQIDRYICKRLLIEYLLTRFLALRAQTFLQR